MTQTKEEEFREVREHMRSAIHAWREGCKTLLPEGFLQKGKEGQKEALLALRSLINVAIDRLEGEGKTEAKAKKQKIEVEDKG
jgi:hypothetical protein